MATLDSGLDQRLQDIKTEYLDFLDDSNEQGLYSEKLRYMISSGQRRLIVNINDLRKKYPKRVQALLNDSFEESVAFQRALKDLVAAADAEYSKQHEEFFIGLEGSFGNKHVTPRSLTSTHLGSLVCVEGIVTKSSLVRPKVVRSVHYCPATKKTVEKKYADMTSLEPFPSSAVYPTKDDEGNLLETEYGLSVYKDHQTFSIQEMPEKAPAGQLPRSVDVVVDDDLVDKCKPGDRVQVVGSYRCIPGKKNGYTSGAFRTILIGNNIRQLNKEVNAWFTQDDVSKIKHFSRQKDRDVFELLAKSMAPSIHGHTYIKKAILCMLLGGVERNLPNGTRIRGDINVLLIGDPSVAKSQVLRYVLNTAPRAVATTGRGSSGVGLTAAVTSDQETNERRLEAGAMVLADRGVVCIDEFDKMSDIDRTAIHEVMEQGRVTIAKAGIHAKLNARCSVLAAANPVYGRYDQHKTPMENIGLQDSLLSRFDLLFIVLDKNDQEQDAMIAEHVLRMHRYRAPQEQEGTPTIIDTGSSLLTTEDLNVDNNADETTQIYEKYNAMLHGNSRKKSDRIVSMQFMRKYLHIAKKIAPQLTAEAAEYVAEEYSKLRSQEAVQLQDNVARTQPITARTLETMIRLATAHAKARLSRQVLLQDAHAAAELVQYAYFKKVLPKEKKRRRNDSDSETEEQEASEESGLSDGENIDPAAAANAPDTPSERTKRASKRQKKQVDPDSVVKKKQGKPGDVDYDPFEFDDEEADSSVLQRSSSLSQQRQSSVTDGTKSPRASDVDGKKQAIIISTSRLHQFRASLFKLFQKEHSQSVSLDSVTAYITEEHQSHPFSSDEIMAAIEGMMEENQIMFSNDFVFLI